MPTIKEARAANAAHTFSYIPIALFAGGTSGIGQAMAEEFAKLTNGNAHIIILGRNRVAAESIIARFPTPTSPDAHHEFVECDVSLMKNVQKTTQAISSRLQRINFLVLSTGVIEFSGRNETEEGIAKMLAVAYYARWKFIHDLAPLLQKAKDDGQDAAVMTVASPYRSNKIDLDDFGLRKHYSIRTVAAAGGTYSDLMVDGFAKRYPTVFFIHIHPGSVRTPIFDYFKHWALRPINWAFKFLSYPFTISPEHCAQYMLWVLLLPKSGSTRRDEWGGDMGPNPYHNDDETIEKLWEHTNAEVERAITCSSSSA